MSEVNPLIVENRYFVKLEEEDIQKLNRSEAAKFAANPHFTEIAANIEAKLGHGEWSEHWVTIDNTGKRVYARVYSTDAQTMALTADGRMVRETTL